MRILYVPEVADDLAFARDWYESRSSGLGEDFLLMAYAAFSELSEFPEQHRVVYSHYRRALLRRFPYSVYYLVAQNSVTIYGVFHSSKNPQSVTGLLDVRS
jgi:plasmid stabilization system protein ParE